MAKQYGIRIRQQKDMSWDEFVTLISGLMPDTPLGAIIGIRAEKDAKTIKAFGPDQRRIHREWRTRQAHNRLDNPEQLQRDVMAISRMFASMFGGGEGNGGK